MPFAPETPNQKHSPGRRLCNITVRMEMNVFDPKRSMSEAMSPSATYREGRGLGAEVKVGSSGEILLPAGRDRTLAGSRTARPSFASCSRGITGFCAPQN